MAAPSTFFSNFFFLLAYLITRTRASENWHSSKLIRSILLMVWLKIAPIQFAFGANLSTLAIHRRCAGEALGQIADCCQFQPATPSQVGRRDMSTRLYGSSSLLLLLALWKFQSIVVVVVDLYVTFDQVIDRCHLNIRIFHLMALFCICHIIFRDKETLD